MTENQNRIPSGVPTGGQFAASAKAEAGVTLMTEPHDGHGPQETCPGCPHGASTADSTGNPYADVLATLPGSIRNIGDGRIYYTDPDGHLYRVAAGKRAITVSSDDTSALSQTIPLAGSSGNMAPEEVLDVLASCQRDATDVRAFNAAAAEWLHTDEDDRGYGYREPDFDDYNGTATFGGVTLTAFTTDHPETGGPALRVEVAYPGDDSPVEFEALSMPDGTTRYVRNGDLKAPLALWERHALDGHLADRLSRNGGVRSLAELLRSCSKNAEQARSR